MSHKYGRPSQSKHNFENTQIALPELSYDDPDDSWRDDALCRPAYVDDPPNTPVFFNNTAEGIAMAKALCAECPVSTQCLDFGLRNKEAFGVWGGYHADELRQMRKSHAL